ncbi:uncharacterized protein CPUR_00164 [Claviceps purpurea 20.1]|uniref:Synaptobrevin n=1 Tax=Claviceps purpurea (strain 20.1) TaxID=1111077 RepID=M1W1D4_CLAP2|nr:hypothetical protein E4U11_001516 [Claviceps purpurea]KAG6263873.1 hypothetical protein E4U49_002018 [Claviceps purpurea]CCE26695.1 uncharacterized protein CPUR_00164 [Claviceps purpurea 20.1]
MARVSQATAISDAAASCPEATLAQLTRLLLRLQQNVLHATPERERRLRTSEFERAKVESNLDHARSVLTTLEQVALRITAPQKRAETQALLNSNRDRLETLLDRLQDLRQISNDENDGSDDEDLLTGMMQTPSESIQSLSSDTNDEPQTIHTPSRSDSREPTPTHESPRLLDSSLMAGTSPSMPATLTTQELRSRSSAQDPTTASTETLSHSSARAALFANRRGPAEPRTSTVTAEAILDQQSAEHDALSESILKMASALKKSSLKFSSTLDADKELLGKAGEGISKTEQSMEKARGRMGALRRMTEGKGWWGRMMLFAWVYGLMVGLLLLVFLMPKLRF